MQQKQDGSSGDKVIGFAHVLAASFASLVAAAAHRWRPESCTVVVDEKIKPHLEKIESGRVARIERFSQYVARQIGFEEDDKVPKLCILAQDYLRKSKGCDQSIYEYLAKEKDGDNLYVKLIDEFERCILSYFAFHWTQAPSITTQVLNTESQQKTKLREILLAATWKQRFERVNKDLKVTRVFSTLVEELKVIHAGDSQSKDVMVPMAHSERSPVLLFMGGGMGAGKSTVLKDILKEPFWLGAATNAVVVEADAFKENDVIYRALNSRGHHAGMLETSESVHQSSTDAASSLLVTALNEGRDVIMDGTLSWEPFVEQTIAMARNVHKRMYRMGVGYKQAEDGTVTENYWEQVNEAGEEYLLEKNSKAEPRSGKPYRIELVGVVCDGYLAVIRGISYSKKCMFGNSFENHGEIKITVKRLKQKLKAVASVHHDFDFIIHYRRISKYAINYYFVGDVIFGYGKVDIPIGTFIYRRAIMTGRAVRVNSQLTSHKRFANAFPRYCNLVDHARLFSTNSIGGPPKLIGLKDGGHNLLVDPEDITCMKKIGSMNAEADSIYELYRESSIIKEPGSVWNDFVMSPSRPNYQKELRESILKIEKSITESTVARNTAAKT